MCPVTFETVARLELTLQLPVILCTAFMGSPIVCHVASTWDLPVSFIPLMQCLTRSALLLFAPLLSLVYLYFSPRLNPQSWNDRSELYDGTFIPSAENLAFAVGESSMMDPNGYIFALFSAPYSTSYNPIPCIPSQCKSPPPRIAVDAFGLVCKISETDFHALRAMAESTRVYAGHDWSARVSYTCQPSQAIILPPDEEKTGYVRVYTHAFNPGATTLVETVTLDNGVTYTTLPEHIIDLLSLVYQRTWGATFGPSMSEEGKEIIEKLKKALR